MLTLSDQVKYLRRQIPGIKALALQYAARGDSQRLLDSLIRAVFRHTLVDGKPPVRALSEFEACIAERGQLFDHGQRLIAAMTEALTLATKVELRLSQMSAPVQGPSKRDMAKQLSWMLRDGFADEAEAEDLLSYPRYLRALDYRCDKLAGNLPREQAQLEKVLQFEQRLAALGEVSGSEVNAFQWLLQEYRVSLFAQPVGTRVPVSEKRLERAWQDLQACLS